jgi:hypothetical protein
MTRIQLLPLFLLIWASNLMAQTSAFTLVNPHGGLDTDQNKVLTYVSNLPRSGDLRHIEWDGQGPVDQNGNISIALPNENGGQPIIFKVTAADYSSPTEYALLGTCPEGEIALYITPEGTGGNIDLVTTSYYLYPLGNAKGLLIEKSPLAAENGTCGTDNLNPENNETLNFCEDDCGNAVLDVLAMVTPLANQWITDNFGWLGPWFLFSETHNINLAFINSEVFNKRVRVRTVNYTPNFPLTNNIENDLNALSANQDAQITLQQSGADVGILLTNQNYGQVFGIANSLDPFSTNKFCISQVAFINSIRYTFAHELAHQFGCLHSNPLTTGCPHGFNMPIGRNTIVANNAPNNTRIQHFSNPDVLFAGQATGVDGARNNAAQIRGAFCEVANNNTPVIFSANFEHEQFVCEGLPFWASGISEGAYQENIWGLLEPCQGPYTYQWSWSAHPNFAISYNIGTNSPWLALNEPPNCPQFYLRLTITPTAGCSTSTFTKLINCQEGVCEVSPRRTPSCPSRLQPLPLRLRLSLPVFPA